MPNHRPKSKADRATLSAAKNTPRWWEERREDVIRLSARDFAKKHHCAIADIEAYQDRFFQTKMAASPIELKPKEWWKEHLRELEFLSVEAFAAQHCVPVDRVEAAKTSLFAVEAWNAERRESEGKSANLRWLEEHHLSLEEARNKAWKLMNPERWEEAKIIATENLSPPAKRPFFAWWKKNLGEPAAMTPEQFCEKYGVELQTLEDRFRYFNTLGKSKMFEVSCVLRGIARSDRAQVMLKHKDELETTEAKRFAKKYHLPLYSFYRLRQRFLEIGLVKTFPVCRPGVKKKSVAKKS
jgi:hypothetical protein